MRLIALLLLLFMSFGTSLYGASDYVNEDDFEVDGCVNEARLDYEDCEVGQNSEPGKKPVYKPFNNDYSKSKASARIVMVSLSGADWVDLNIEVATHGVAYRVMDNDKLIIVRTEDNLLVSDTEEYLFIFTNK